MRKIKITAGDVTATGILNDSATADAIWNALPISARANTWGDEIYFEIPVKAEEEKDATDLVDLGTLAYWPPGNAFCIFFGPTPASRGEEIRAASAVNLVGKIEGDATVFKKVTGGSAVTIEKA
ncbi:MAG: hypothetical protein JRH18_03190 [Deltaproteobacteria bacterium]|nr:hypothetical protein [Deltaproteobacteria bacterium]MBW1995822.1 hypothetical protein [Deltaproteobacteria bacterium]MBW2150654.1 hypothetical protein [Deltaproteobacteria bacterium]